MSNDIKVNPSGKPNAVRVLTDEVIIDDNNVHVPVYKIGFSVEGVDPVQVSTADPLPVLIDSTIPVDVNISSPDPLPVSGPLTDTELRDSPVPVLGPLTDTELRAAPVNVNVSSPDPLPVILPAPTGDAFGRLRVSTPFTLFDSKLINSEKQDVFWDEETVTGSGVTASTPTAGKPYIDVLSTVSTASNFVRQTYQRFNYQPGKSQLILMTGVLELSGGGTGVERYIGALDDNNGLAFHSTSTGVSVMTRSNVTETPVDTDIAQASWNLDKMDGTSSADNPSGITADFTKSQIFVFDFQWLSIGRVRFGLEIGGELYYVHELSEANTSTEPWASTPNNPLRYQQITTASSPASSMRAICCAVLSEGGADFTGITQSEGTTGKIAANSLGTFYMIAAGRLKTTHTGTTVSPIGVSVVAITKDPFEWQMLRNPTVAGTVTYADKAGSSLQTAVGDQVGNPSTNTVTGGNIVARGYGGSGQSDATAIRSKVVLGVAIDGTRDTFVLAVRPLTVNMDVEGALLWDEIT